MGHYTTTVLRYPHVYVASLQSKQYRCNMFMYIYLKPLISVVQTTTRSSWFYPNPPPQLLTFGYELRVMIQYILNFNYLNVECTQRNS